MVGGTGMFRVIVLCFRSFFFIHANLVVLNQNSSFSEKFCLECILFWHDSTNPAIAKMTAVCKK